MFSVAGDRGFGGFGVYFGMSAMGMEMVENLLNWMRYGCCPTSWEGSRGMSMTVPEQSVWVDGSSWVIQVPEGKLHLVTELYL